MTRFSAAATIDIFSEKYSEFERRYLARVSSPITTWMVIIIMEDGAPSIYRNALTDVKPKQTWETYIHEFNLPVVFLRFFFAEEITLWLCRFSELWEHRWHCWQQRFLLLTLTLTLTLHCWAGYKLRGPPICGCIFCYIHYPKHALSVSAYWDSYTKEWV